MRDPGTAGITFLCSPGLAGTDRTHRRELVPSGFPKNRRRSGNAGKHVGHTCREVAWRSKPEGLAGLRPPSEETFLSLSRLVRRRKRAGRSADDAVLTLKSFLLATLAEPRINNSKFFSGALRGSGDVTRHWRLGQLTKRRSRTFITRPIARKTNNVAEPP